MNPIFLLDATFIMTITFLFAMFFRHEPDKPTTVIPATILFIYGAAYFAIGKYFFGLIEVFTGLGWILLYKIKGEKNE